MKLTTIAFKNVRKNLSFYSLYLFSVALILTVFFTFMSFSLNDIMMSKISEDGRVETMTRTISVFLMAFVLFYMSYSNQFFMKRRMKELGIYTLLGYRKSAMLALLTIENILISLGALLIGITMGALAHKGIIAGVSLLLNLEINTSSIPLFNGKAVFYSAVFVFAVILVLSLSNWRLLRKTTLLSLVRLEKTVEKPIKVRVSAAILGLLLMISGDLLAIDVIRGKESLWKSIGVAPMGLSMVLMIAVGTSFVIYSFLPYLFRKLEHRKGLLYKDIAIVTIPKFIYRIRTNAKTLIMLSLLIAGTLGVFGSTALTMYYPVAAVNRIIPSALEFPLEKPEQADRAVQALNEAIGSEQFTVQQSTLIKIQSQSDNLPAEYALGREPGFELMALSDYNRLLHQQGKKAEYTQLEETHSILIKYRSDPKQRDVGQIYRLSLPDNQLLDITVRDTTLSNPIGFNISVGTLIVSDEIYHRLSGLGLPEISVMSIDGKNLRDSKAAYEALRPVLKDNPYFASSYARTYDIMSGNSSTFLLLGFLTVLFFIAAGSILYFHNISAVSYEQSDYEILGKMGYSKKKIKKVIRNQILVMYAIPFGIGFIHSICGLICYKGLLIDDILGQSWQIFVPVAMALVIAGVIFGIYYLITRRTCYRTVFPR
ncbi:ABC transporter, permease component associated with salivaricin lantibiotic [Paenibacillus alvei TS-15]|uniref:ABC transporter, permease component associated with salivaricin lantibiotic n=1 Tax=Paenibacillus alvei TS-15 TaxID=1117108 RepID=S9SH30_PAEAL|nr:ABC transporter permease [Paenibacillus alvei]EPY05112.1 ABC transporter, permease component associated with salivaricin lantibiotic [Paenibacillus alvei TS-15]